MIYGPIDVEERMYEMENRSKIKMRKERRGIWSGIYRGGRSKQNVTRGGRERRKSRRITNLV